jgi:hypothetical protein
VSVHANDGCGSSADRTKNIISAPGAATTIYGLDTVCTSQTNVTYSIDPIYGATTYTWTIPSVVTLLSGQGTTAITVQFPNSTLSRTLVVKATNACGMGVGRSKVVIVKSCARMDLPDVGANYQLSVYPNPVSTDLHLFFNSESDTPFKMSLIDLSGRELLIKPVNATEGLNEVTWDLSNVAEGLYMVRLSGPNGDALTRIVVQ